MFKPWEKWVLFFGALVTLSSLTEAVTCDVSCYAGPAAYNSVTQR